MEGRAGAADPAVTAHQHLPTVRAIFTMNIAHSIETHPTLSLTTPHNVNSAVGTDEQPNWREMERENEKGEGEGERKERESTSHY